MRRTSFSDNDVTYAQLAISAVAMEFGTPNLNLACLKKSGTHMALVRQVTMYLLRGVFESSFVNIAQTFNRHPSTVRHAMQVIEEERDDPVLDAKIARLEDFLHEAKHGLG